LASDHHLQITDDAVNVSLGCSAAPVGCFGGKLDRDRVAHVLLWFAVVAFDVIKMNEIMPPVYRENRFSVDFEENPMFMRVKQWSLFCDQHELGEELDLRTAVDLAVVDPAVDHGVPFGLADAQLGVQADYFDFDGWLGFVEETHR
jgi:hypothetical protein